jgi:hypothetical protein
MEYLLREKTAVYKGSRYHKFTKLSFIKTRYFLKEPQSGNKRMSRAITITDYFGLNIYLKLKVVHILFLSTHSSDNKSWKR